MILLIKKLIFVFIIFKFKSNKNLSYNDLNFRKIDYTNYEQVKSYIFKKNFYKNNNKNIHSFDFLNFSNKLGGKIGINLSKESIFGWFQINKNKSLIFTIKDEILKIEKSIFLGGKKILDNTCISISGNLVNKNKSFNWEIKKKI